jgi:hypothetical protein
MPHIDSLGSEDISDMFNYVSRERKQLATLECIRLAKQREALRLELVRLNEISRLANAKQVLFDFAEPGEDWGSTTK